jgi:ABC-type sugar transport system substrate-binding protein/DNA-binding response OmpR family regulator
VNKEMQREISFYPEFSLRIKSAKDDTRQQIEDIESFIDDCVSLLVVAPNESATITPLVKKAIDKGIPIILLDRKVELDNYTAYVGANNYSLAFELGKYVANLLNGKGRVVEVRGLNGATADIERHQGFVDAIGQYPGIEIVAECRGDFLRDAARERMDSILMVHDKIDLVFAMNDQMALGVSEALGRYSGKRPYIIGIDALPGSGGGVEYIGQGIIDASFIYPTGGDKVIETAYNILSGKPYEKDNILNTAVVDRSNVHVIQLQGNQINELQNKFDRLNVLLNNSMIQYANQRTLVIVSLVLTLLVIMLFVGTLSAYRFKSRTNLKLKRQNEEIQAQTIELEQQKQHLISLSADLEEATNAKLIFFTNISHELKTPLSLIMGPVEELLSRKSETPQFYKLLTLIKRNSNRLLSLISEIIEFRAYENKKLPLKLSQCDLVTFLEEINEYFTEMANEKHISFGLSTDGGDFTTYVDMVKIEKVYFNMLSNAFKHVNTNGSIETHLWHNEESGVRSIHLSVFNTGSYIPSEQIDNIFSRFYAMDFQKGSAGIGLALSKSIVELHGGTIHVESDESLGTTFVISLPSIYSDDDHPAGADSPAPHETEYIQQQLLLMQRDIEDPDFLGDTNQVDPDKPQLLLIEDNPDMLNFLSEMLRSEYTVIKARDGEEGVQTATKYIPDIIVSDVMMPSIDGFTVCQTLKGHISTSHIPIILLTALSHDEQKTIGFENGADAYISKPFNITILRIRIRNLIENRRKIREAFGNHWTQDKNGISLVGMEQDFINRFRAYVEENVQKEEMGIDEIAAYLGLSRAQLYRKVKYLTNYTPLELVTMTRLHYSRGLMLSGIKTISEVAYTSGFASPAHFTKTFKKYYGQSPSEFIKESKNCKK